MDYNTASKLFEKLSKIEDKMTELSDKIEKNYQKMMEGFKCIRMSAEKQMEFNETLEDVAEYTGTLDVDYSCFCILFFWLFAFLFFNFIFFPKIISQLFFFKTQKAQSGTPTSPNDPPILKYIL